MVVEAIMRSAEETASADTSLIKDLLSREMCINTQLITVSNGEERFKAGQRAGPLSAQRWKLHQMKLYAFLLGTKAISSAGPEWETHRWASLRHHSFSYFETEQIKWGFFFVPSGEYKSGCDSFMKPISKENIHGRLPWLWPKLHSRSCETRFAFF